MTDEITPISPASEEASPAQSCEGGATPEELLAEQLADDPEVGADGTGAGQLP